ncbi:unnamed protein product [Zymoseptoria tritici ST99CH_3D7]|uniref:BTB domain-containing protein n=1 Tax=Zymoseptoria tritici (strain ST99CH_3D7) TaxID=1276538 RepID=A0A1X7S564_ZYMT9|nr:unnamed protein product [Zymoseptoria tritici ST99CH_3D7]
MYVETLVSAPVSPSRAVAKVINSAGCKFFEAACSSITFDEEESATITVASAAFKEEEKEEWSRQRPHLHQSHKDKPSCDGLGAAGSMVSYFSLPDAVVEKLEFLSCPSSLTRTAGCKFFEAACSRNKRLSEFWQSGKFSDFAIKCGPHELKVHKVIVSFSAGCKFFEAAYSSDTLKEGQSATITLVVDKDDPSCDDPDAVRARTFICFCCSSEIPSLRRAAVDKFRGALRANSEHPGVADAITTVFTTTQEEVRELRDIVSDFLVASKTLLRRDDIEAAVNNVQGLTLDLVHRLQTTLAAQKRKVWDVQHRDIPFVVLGLVEGNVLEGCNG